jgi:hypothetical protein
LNEFEARRIAALQAACHRECEPFYRMLARLAALSPATLVIEGGQAWFEHRYSDQEAELRDLCLEAVSAIQTRYERAAADLFSRYCLPV